MIKVLTSAIFPGRRAVEENTAKLLRDPAADQDLSGSLTPKQE